MFEGPRYESYIALCRELRLEREWQDGDGFVYATGPAYATEPIVFSRLQPDSSRRCWLPRLDQLLAMLEEAGHETIAFIHSGHPSRAWRVLSDRQEESDGPTREEAALRLWRAVTGWSVAT